MPKINDKNNIFSFEKSFLNPKTSENLNLVIHGFGNSVPSMMAGLFNSSQISNGIVSAWITRYPQNQKSWYQIKTGVE